jgi:beta-lactamase regulating signal transducer with metallopeptidase domain
MRDVFAAVLLMSAAGTFMYLLALLLRPLTAKRFDARWHYRVCALVLFFLLVPVGALGGQLYGRALSDAGREPPGLRAAVDALISPLEDPAAPVPAAGTDAAPTTSARPAGGEALSATAPDAAPETAPAPDGTGRTGLRGLLTFLPAAWLLGAAAFLTAAAVRHLRFYRKLARTSLPVEDAETLAQLDACRRALGLSRTPALASNSLVRTPMLTGLFRCALVLPEVALDADELRLIFRHELTHLKRRDIWLKLLSLISNAVHWFNPAAYALRRELGTFCELSCDERVVSGLDARTRRFYGRTILGVMTRAASGGGLYTALAMSRRGFEKRLGRILDYRRPARRAAAFATALALLLALTGLLTSCLLGARRTQTNELAVCIDSDLYARLQGAMGDFALQNPGVTITYEILPAGSAAGGEPDGAARNDALARLRAELMEGRGPDLFLLSAQDMDRTPGGFFEDAEEAVRSGVFCDLLPLFKEAGISEDDFLRPVLDAGKVGGRQYVVPLCYEVLAVLTNDTTRAALGDAAFEDTAAMLRAVRGLTQTPGTGAQSATGFYAGINRFAYLMNPFCLAGPAEDDERYAALDTPLARDILETGKLAQDRLGGPDALRAGQSGLTLAAWEDYARSERYLQLCRSLAGLVEEASLTAYAGVTPRLDAVPSADGGVTAVVTAFAGIRAGSANMLNAVSFIKLLLSDEVQSSADLAWGGGWPVLTRRAGRQAVGRRPRGQLLAGRTAPVLRRVYVRPARRVRPGLRAARGVRHARLPPAAGCGD